MNDVRLGAPQQSEPYPFKGGRQLLRLRAAPGGDQGARNIVLRFRRGLPLKTALKVKARANAFRLVKADEDEKPGTISETS